MGAVWYFCVSFDESGGWMRVRANGVFGNARHGGTVLLARELETSMLRRYLGDPYRFQGMIK